jgi:hypothetical protein
MITRRQFVGSLASGLAVPGLQAAGWRPVEAAEPRDGGSSPPAGRRKKIAFLGTSFYRHSHSQHFLDRFAAGYSNQGVWVPPALEVAGVYVDQHPANDISRQQMAKYGLRTFPTVAETLTLGGSELAVDGVVIIGEHGDYPRNEKGQTLYPRYRWFKEIVDVFERSKRVVPVFNDKHLSTDWGECVEMVADSRRLGFPFYAGSSLPVTWRLPALKLPLNTSLVESVCVAYGGVESYDFHTFETTQCISERRPGGEVGIRSVHAVRDAKCWELLAKREVTQKLFLSALRRSHNLPVDNGYPTGPVEFDWARQALPEMVGYFIEHRDGFRTSTFLTKIRDFNYAGLRGDTGQIIGAQFWLPMPGFSATTADFFTPLVELVTQMILTNQTDYPIDRTLLTSGMVIGGIESLFKGQQPYATPDMAVAYQAPEREPFWNG